MAAKITPQLVELTYEAVLKSFWRKESLRKFLRASHVAEAFLARWNSDESKRDFLDRGFQKLQASDRGKAVIYGMARSLSEQMTFPDLRNWEDSAKKVAEATKAVDELKAYLKTQDERFAPSESAKKPGPEPVKNARRYNEALRTKPSSSSALMLFTPRLVPNKEATTFKTGFTTFSNSVKYRTDVHM